MSGRAISAQEEQASSLQQDALLNYHSALRSLFVWRDNVTLDVRSRRLGSDNAVARAGNCR